MTPCFISSTITHGGAGSITHGGAGSITHGGAGSITHGGAGSITHGGAGSVTHGGAGSITHGGAGSVTHGGAGFSPPTYLIMFFLGTAIASHYMVQVRMVPVYEILTSVDFRRLTRGDGDGGGVLLFRLFDGRFVIAQ